MSQRQIAPSTGIYVFLVLGGFIALAGGFASGQSLMGFGFAVASWGLTYLIDVLEYHLGERTE